MKGLIAKERKHMKGFIYIVEIIIAGLTLLVVISLSADIPRIEHDWTKTKLIIYGNDLFFTLDEKGINWFDRNEVSSSIRNLLPMNMEFDIRVKNAIKPVISLGCACPQDMLDTFREFLDDFELNGANTSFRLEWIDPSNPSFPVTLDLILFLDMHIPDGKRNELENYLKSDKGVLEISGMDRDTISETIYRDIFNLGWIEESISMQGVGGLQDTEPGKANYNMRKYFHHVPFRTDLSPDLPPKGITSCTSKYLSGSFTIRESSYKLWVIDNSTYTCDLALYIDMNGNGWLNDSGEGPYGEGETPKLEGYKFLIREINRNHTELLFQDQEYRFKPAKMGETIYPRDNSSDRIFLKRADVLYPDGRSVPLSTINHNVMGGKGRVAWLSNSTASYLKSDVKQLIKSMIIWTAGEEYWLVRGREKVDATTFYFFKPLNQDMFQPVEFILTLGFRQ